MLRLSPENLSHFTSPDLEKPPAGYQGLPEKVLQFGAGILLRSLPDYFIDQANRRGEFLGRVLVVKSTDSGNEEAFQEQDQLYTICVRGKEAEKNVSRNIISGAISRVLNASSQWKEVLAAAHNPALKIIISNTTETGLRFCSESIFMAPPQSFPGKLLAFLFERFKAFGGKIDSGMLIIPTELIPDNGAVLKDILLRMADENKLDDVFKGWLSYYNRFCNSLVDRIVPGKPALVEREALFAELGYRDELVCVAEAYKLWAIEGDEKVASMLGLGKAEQGLVVTPNIELYRELKLRLLNGTHSLCCGPAVLLGFDTVLSALNDPVFFNFTSGLMYDEIAGAIPYVLAQTQAKAYASTVLDRFQNSHLQHFWLTISTQYSQKLRLRVVPILLKWYKTVDHAPARIAFAFAAYIRFMKSSLNEEGFRGEYQGTEYPITDEQASKLHRYWHNSNGYAVIESVLGDPGLWGSSLLDLPGFAKNVWFYLEKVQNEGIRDVIKEFSQN